MQSVHLLCCLVAFSLLLRDYVHVFPLRARIVADTANYAALCINVNSTRKASSSSLCSSAALQPELPIPLIAGETDISATEELNDGN